MNAKQVLNKIMTLLSKDEVAFTYARLKDGTIVESATFDVGEDLFVVSEDGTKTPAPDGEHELALKDSEGEETLLKVITKDGKIVERENVELELADAETKKVEDLPQTNVEEEANIVKDIKSPASDDKGLKPASMMAEVTEEVDPNMPETDGEPMEDEAPEIEIELGDLAKKMEEMSYRIEEMEKKMMDMEKVKEEVVDKEADIEEEMELPKLDGAPVETKMSAEKAVKFGKKVANTQDRFLSKLYK
jgi:hypothetical protein